MLQYRLVPLQTHPVGHLVLCQQPYMDKRYRVLEFVVEALEGQVFVNQFELQSTYVYQHLSAKGGHT